MKPLNIDPNMDDLIVTVATEGVDLAELLNPLDHLVNVALPDALENL